MKPGALVLAVLVLCAVNSNAQEQKYRTEDGVVVLDDKNFDGGLKMYDVLLVEFYAPWCGFCKQLKPEYAAAAKELAKEEKPITLAKVDVIKQEKVGERFKVESFPTLKVFLNHEPKAIKWEGNPSKSNILEKMKKYRKDTPFKSPAKNIGSVKEAEKFGKGYARVLGIFDGEESDAFKTFGKAAVFQAYRDFLKFGVSTSSEVAAKYGVKAPAVLVLKQFDEKKDVAPADVLDDVEKLQRWIETYSRPIVCAVTNDKSDCGMLSPMLTVITEKQSGPEYEAFAKVAKEAREKEGTSPKTYFGWMAAKHKAVAGFFELQEEELPTVAGLIRGGMSVGGVVKFHIDKNEYEDIDEATVREVADAFTKGEMDPTLPSADPVDDAEDDIKTVVTSEWQERVVDAKQDVLIEFFAPWCSMCKSIKPFYDELGKVFSDVDNIMLAKLDATSNDIYYPKITIEGYPTFFWIPANTKKAEIFDKWSNKNVNEMRDWIVEHSSKAVDKSKLKKAGEVKEEKGEEQKLKSEAGASEDPVDDKHLAVKTLVMKNFKERVIDGGKHWFVDFYAPWCGHCKTLAPKFDDTARAYTGDDVMFGKVDPTANDIPAIVPGFEVTSFPSLYWFDKSNPLEPVEYKGPKYKEEMLEFVNGGYKNAAKTQLKSAEAVDDSSMAVKIVVGSTFSDRVLKSGKNSLMEFYAPWCGHCKQLAPKYEEVAKEMTDFFIGKMDLTANELPKKYASKVAGYPTLLYFPHDDPKNPITYDGAREVNDIKKFLKEQAQADADDADEL